MNWPLLKEFLRRSTTSQHATQTLSLPSETWRLQLDGFMQLPSTDWYCPCKVSRVSMLQARVSSEISNLRNIGEAGRLLTRMLNRQSTW